MPERRDLPKINIKPREIPFDQIVAVKGRNPVGESLPMFGKVISDAMMNRANLIKMGRETAAIEKAAGVNPGTYNGMNSEQGLEFAKMQNELRLQELKQKKEQEKPTRSVFASEFKKNPEPYLQFEQGGGKLNFINDLSEGNRRDNLDVRKDSMVLNWASKMRSDPNIKPLYQQKINAGYVDQIIGAAKEGNTVAGSALAAKMARTMGEVGVLTDNDVKRYVTSGRLDRGAADKLSRMAQGKPTDATLDEIGQIAGILSSTFNEKVQPTYNWYAEVLANNMGDSPENTARLLGVSYMPNTNAKTLSVQQTNQMHIPVQSNSGIALSGPAAQRLAELRAKKASGTLR
ncbi:MAG TPA: hypothetical protein PLN86_16940 [Candidatus Hydrogenedentes bacterium]|nr:hypothetical protein [Candidatus Hydrogenedentota bacterium]